MELEKSSELSEDQPLNNQFSLESIKRKKEERRELARKRKEDIENNSVIKIQSLYRGVRDRQLVGKMIKSERFNNDMNTIGSLIIEAIKVENLETQMSKDTKVFRPYVKILFGEYSKSTLITYESNPDWKKDVSFPISSLEELQIQSIQVQVRNQESESKDILIGYTSIELKNIPLWGISYHLESLNPQDNLSLAFIKLNIYYSKDNLELEEEEEEEKKLKENEEEKEEEKIKENEEELNQEKNILFHEEINSEREDEEKDDEIHVLSTFQMPENIKDTKEDTVYEWPIPLEKEDRNLWKDVTNTEELILNKILRVFVSTWNLQAKKPAEDLSSFLNPGKFHIYAIGTQECVNSIAKSVIFHSKKEWEDHLRRSLGPNYMMICSHSLQAIHNIVFVHKSVLPLLSIVQSSAVATGLGNQLGNKGGIGIGFKVGETSFIFISSHFEAHQNRVEKRNANFHRINKELRLIPNGIKSDAIHPITQVFDRIFWAGDFNYRINGTRKMIDTLLEKKMHNVLLFNDQLSIEKRLGNVFEGFQEGPLNFYPTYKLDRGSDVYDTSQKQRIPSWTDRVLCKSVEENGIELFWYNSYPHFHTSDHRPVVAGYNVRFVCNESPSIASQSDRDLSVDRGQIRSEVCEIQ